MVKPTRRLGRDRDGTFDGRADAHTAWAAVAVFVFFLAASASEVTQ